VFADDLGRARHLVVSPAGIVYVNTWSGRYYGNRPPVMSGFLVALQDTRGSGRADVIRRFATSSGSCARACRSRRNSPRRCRRWAGRSSVTSRCQR
jgi:hypothetical protein